MKLILQAIKALLRKLEKRFDAVIPAPKSATVGQMLVVKAVDESGKPTEWETVKQLDEKFIPDSIARKENIPAAPMMVTTRSVDAGSAFDPSVTVAEMLEALKSGTPVWVQISDTYYPVSVFNSYTILCRKNGTRVYRVTSPDYYFREVNG